MPHAPPRRRGLPCDKPHNGLLPILLAELRGFLFGGATDLPHHDDQTSLAVFIEKPERIDEVCPNDRITTNSDAGRLPDLAPRKLPHRLIGQSPAAGNHSHVAFLVNAAWHNPYLALTRRDNPRAVRANLPASRPGEGRGHAHHVERGNSLRDAHNQRNVGRGRLHDRIRRKSRRDKDHRGIRPFRVYSLACRVENRNPFVPRSSLSRSYAGHDISSIRHTLLRVKRTLTSRDPLHHQSCVFVNQDGQLVSLCSAVVFRPDATKNLAILPRPRVFLA